MPHSSTALLKNKQHQFFTVLVGLVLLLNIGTPIIAAAAAYDPDAFKPSLAIEAIWNNSVNLFTHPVNQVSKAASATVELLTPEIAKMLSGITFFILKLAGFFLQSMGGIMDFAIQLSIALPINESSVVTVGWTAVRDFANMFFIFAILYIAIQTILGLAGGNTKRMLAHIIIAAVLINFSLFATTVVVDAGNILAVSFWDKMKVDKGGKQLPSAAQKFIGKFDVQTILAKPKAPDGKDITVDPMNETLINIGGTIIMVIAGYVFLAGALMMITRTVMLVILMIFSPFAFMCFGLPKLEKYGHDWLEKLISQTFAAPFFIFMLYLSSVVIDNVDLLAKTDPNKGQAWSSVFLGQTDAYMLIYNFIMLIGFLIASITVANKFAGDTGSHARGWAKSATKWAGGAAVGTAAYGMRQGLGKVGMMTKESETLHNMAAQRGWRGMVGRGAIALSSGAARATFDPRATKLGSRLGIGAAGGAGGFEATGSVISKATAGFYGYQGTAAEKEVQEIAERRYKNDPAGKAAYLRANLGTEYKRDEDGKIREKARYDAAGEHKELREKVKNKITTEEVKNAIKENVEKYDKLNTVEQTSAIGESIAKLIGESMRNLSSREIAELVPKYAGSGGFVGNLTKQNLHTINQLDTEGKYGDAGAYDSHNILGTKMTLQERVAEGVFNGNNQGAKEYLASPEGQEKLFNIPVEKEKNTVEQIRRNRSVQESTEKTRVKDVDQAMTAAYAEKAGRDSDAELERIRRDIPQT